MKVSFYKNFNLALPNLNKNYNKQNTKTKETY